MEVWYLFQQKRKWFEKYLMYNNSRIYEPYKLYSDIHEYIDKTCTTLITHFL